MIRYAALEKPPEGLQFPSELQGRIWHEPERRRLAFEGVMCKATYDRLYGLSSDVRYQVAIQELFVKCVEGSPPRRAMHCVVLTGTAIVVAIVGLVIAMCC